ncbi:MAG: CBS domain-containing protein [Myxococcales bacterium]|nr:CBS domain-containing protein [Myxococcales bacterium]
MGSNDVRTGADDQQMRAFTRAVLDDLEGLEKLILEDRFETGIRRIGAEQEMFLIDRANQPAPVAVELLEMLKDDERITTELARFNLEANLTPQVFGGSCLRNIEREAEEVLQKVDDSAAKLGAAVVLTGILPTLRLSHLRLDNMTPKPRYFELNRAATHLRGGAFSIVIKGLDELDITHDNVMLESANTSFQIHFQVGPEEFARLYNLAQAISGPVLAAAVNSPLLFGQRLWNETRVALFQRSIDVRSAAHQRRATPPRVSFGDAWVKSSILEIYKDDIARYRVLFSTGELDENPMKVLAQGGLPELRALRMHTSTVWRWNRACYGTKDGRPHLRIENRILPAGPTLLDEVSNAAFFFGLMAALADEHPRIDKVMEFDDAKNNFFAAARHGLSAQFAWINGEVFTAHDLIVENLLPRAREGLASHGIDAADIDRYLGTIHERVGRHQTGAAWALRSFAKMSDAPVDVRMRSLVSAMHEHEWKGAPVHTWPLARLHRTRDWFPSYRTVGQFMKTELVTVRPGDPVDLAASVMDWRNLRHLPVEDDHGKLVGLITFRSLLRMMAALRDASEPVLVRDVMYKDPLTVTADTPTLPALETMRRENVGCLPVIDDEGGLIGLVTVYDLLEIAEKVLSDFLRADETGTTPSNAPDGPPESRESGEGF